MEASTHPEIEMIVVDDASTEPRELERLGQLERESQGARLGGGSSATR